MMAKRPQMPAHIKQKAMANAGAALHALIASSTNSAVSAKAVQSFMQFQREFERKEVMNKVARLAFVEAYRDRVDADHWATLIPVINDLANLRVLTQIKYVKHMLDAFERGERFIVAKLTYDG